MLPYSSGMMMDRAKAPPVFVTSGFTQNATFTTGITVSGLSGIQAGDLLIAVCSSRGNGDAASATGFTSRANIGLGSPSGNMTVLTKVAAGGETSVAFAFGSGTYHSAAVLVYRNAAFGSAGTPSASADNNATAPGMTCVGGGLLLNPVVGTTDNPTSGLTSSTSRVAFNVASNCPSTRVVDKPSTAGATGSIVGSFSSGWLTVLLEILPL